MPLHFTRSFADTLYVPQANTESTLGANFTITAANGTYEDTGLSITLPSAGTYVIFTNARVVIGHDGDPSGFMSIKLFNSTDAVDVADSERIVFLHAQNTTFQASSAFSKIVTVNGSKTIKLYAKRDGADTWTSSIIASDANGRTSLAYQKLAP